MSGAGCQEVGPTRKALHPLVIDQDVVSLRSEPTQSLVHRGSTWGTPALIVRDAVWTRLQSLVNVFPPTSSSSPDKLKLGAAVFEVHVQVARPPTTASAAPAADRTPLSTDAAKLLAHGGNGPTPSLAQMSSKGCSK
mmetsp:Transcript_52661/g.140409  ORF Transcript_52661/g.140409 Transcript_52661/m.140409 type:complete len:137 (+) Transcript_52661:396-806(+)